VVRTAAVVLGLPLALNVVLPGVVPVGVMLYGAVIGALYGLIAIGIVLVHRANRVVNFAQAGLGAVPAVVALLLITDKGLPYALALPVLVVGSLLLGAAVYLGIIRRFANSPRLVLAVVTIGVAQLLAYVEFNTPRVISGEVLPPQTFPTPFGGFTFELGGTVFSGDHLTAVVVCGICVAGLAAFLRYTRVGIAVRAAAENGERAALLGIPVQRLSVLVWAIAALLSALGIFLRAPLVGLPIGTIIGPSILLFALAAAVIAKLESMPAAFGAGVALGVVDLSVFFATRNSRLSEAVILPVILVALLLQRRGLSRAQDGGASSWRAVGEARRVPHQLRDVREVVRARTAAVVVVAVLALGLPFAVGELYRNDASLVLIYALIAVSLVVLTGWAGQISLGQFAFVGIGAAVAGGLAADRGQDFFVTLFAAGLVGAVFAVLIGLPALRLPGLYLAVTTLAFAACTQAFFLNRDYFEWVLPDQGNPVLRPVLYGRIDTSGDLAFYYLCLTVLLLGLVVARQLRRSRTGRILLAVRDNPKAAQAYGVHVARSKLAAFGVSGWMAATAGALFAYHQGAVDTGAFPVVASLQVFAMAVVGGIASLGGAVVGAVYLIGAQRFPVISEVPLIELLATGVGLIILLTVLPGGLAEIGVRTRDAFLRRVADKHGIHVPSLLADSRQTEAEAPQVSGAELGREDEPPPDDEEPAPAQEPTRRRSRSRS
jgi:branched-chain amino acid transport system permease protein